ncbi:MAG: 30S ribosomal protein S2 [Candidatus Micrarchaeaceae archaeon]
MLIDQKQYIDAGVHIGTKVKTPGMNRFIFKVREEGLYILDLPKIDQRISIAAKMLARYDPSKILVTASRIYTLTPASKFAESIGAKIVKGRVMPGMLTNPNREDYIEPAVILVSDSRNERQAIKEASKTNIVTIALSDTDNWIKHVDLVIPCNNKGRRSLALVYYLLTREVLRNKGVIKSPEEFSLKPSDFESTLELKATR